ncbi:unnamed protein product, partial [Brenthis ino]
MHGTHASALVFAPAVGRRLAYRARTPARKEAEAESSQVKVLRLAYNGARPISLRLANCAGDIIVHKCTRRHNVHSLFLSLSYSGGTTTRHDQRELRQRTDGFTCSPRHGGETPPTSQLRAVTEAYYTERLNN